MKARCHNPRDKAYYLYGARGIVVCERWRKSFADFAEDVGPRPSPQHSLDRHPNPDGNYESGNVRWATDVEQNRNRREYNILVPLGGSLVTVAEWSEATGRSAHIVYERLKRGWSPEDAITAEPNATRGQQHLGMKRSEAARANMAAAQRRRWATTGRLE